MSRHHIYISDDMCAENVEEFFIESNEPIENILKAIALNELEKQDLLDADYIESISFAHEEKEMVVIQLADYHISIWEGDEKIQDRTIDKKYFNLAKQLNKDFLDNEDEIEKLIDKIEDFEEIEKDTSEIER